MQARWLSVSEIAAHLGVNPGTMYKWIDRKRMPAHKLGRLWKFLTSEVDQWIKAGHAVINVANEMPAERVAPAKITGVELSMDVLGRISDAADALAKLGGFFVQYREWIKKHRLKIPTSPKKRRDTAEELLNRAGVAAKRIEQGVALLAAPVLLDAFRIANRTMAEAARRRLVVMQGKDLRRSSLAGDLSSLRFCS